MATTDLARETDPSRLSPRKFTTAAVALLLITAVFALYRNTPGDPFVLDDISSIHKNLSIRQLWPLENATIGGTRGRPVANALFALDYAWGGDRPTVYHLTSIAIHAAVALVLFGLIRRTLRLPLLKDNWAGAADIIAASSALVWAVHPLPTAAVTYLAQQAELLVALCYLLTLYCFVRAVASTENARAWYALAVVACVAGMASKEVMVTAPILVLLYDRAFVANGLVGALRARSRFYLTLASSWVVLAILMSGIGERGIGHGLNVTPIRYALTECCVVLKYLRLAAWPTPLVFDYGTGNIQSLAEAWPCVLVMMMIVTAVLMALMFRPALGFLLAWPFLILAPTSSIVPVALQPMGENRMYLPLAGLVVTAVILLWRAVGNRAWIPIALLGVALGIVTDQRNKTYSNTLDLWRDTVEKRPENGRAHLHLAVAYLNAQLPAEARVHLARALALDPRDEFAWSNLGLLCAQDGQYTEAIHHFETATRLNPGLAEAHYNLGYVLLRTGRTPEAAKEFLQTILINPDHSDAHNNLGTMLAAAGRDGAAIAHYSEALRISPRDAEIFANRANAYLKLGQRANALADFQTALELRPTFESVSRKLSELRATPEK